MQKFKKLKYVQRVLVFLLAFCIAFAGSSTDAMAKSKKAPAVKSISLKIGKKKVTKKTYKMKLGEKKKIKVNVSPKKVKNVVQFATSNRKVVAVSKKGTVTAKKTGTAKIKVTVKKGASKKKGRVAGKKTTWVKIKVDKASNLKDKTDSETGPPEDQNSTPPVTPQPEEPTPPPTETPIPDETLPPLESETPTPSVTPEPGDAEQGKSLIVYFSCTDTTKKIAEYMQEITGADIYRIEPEVPYTTEDLNYGDASTRATREQNDSSARPAIAGKLENMSSYQNIVIAYPIWLAYHNLIQCTQA